MPHGLGRFMNEGFGSLHRGMSQQAREDLIQEMGAWLETRSEIVFAYVFGSFPCGEYFQDIDVALYVRPESFDHARDLEEEYAQFLSDGCKEIFHVVIINHAPSSLACSIFREGRNLFCRDEHLLGDCIERCSLDMLANEGVSRQSLREIVS